ncbi:MAG TPA: hypothetical protein PKC29_04775 [Thermodesulfobacteriota bacterium]|nr:hypothetical protein [Thermodesulfobacteriota bacterium]
MDSKISDAIEVLQAELEEQERNIIKVKETINFLLAKIGKEPRYAGSELNATQISLRPDIFYGKPLATAIREYLEWKGVACKVEEILQGLEEGGFDFEWKEKDRLRNLAINISKNTAVFHKLPNSMIGLLIWYPEAMKKKNERERALENAGVKEPEVEINEKTNENSEIPE